MPEGEVVFRVGLPDPEPFIRNVKGQPEEMPWAHLPQPGDPQTLTTVTPHGSIVASSERKISPQRGRPPW